MSGIYEDGLGPVAANFTALSPLSFMRRSQDVYPQRLAVIYGQRRDTWSECYRRCVQVADALTKRGVERGTTVAILAANIPELFEAHFAIPMAGAVLNAINTRLDAATIRFILEHGEARVFLVDREFGEVAEQALVGLESPPLVIGIDDQQYPGGKLIGALDYQTLVAEGDGAGDCRLPDNEWDAIALNYTSGTTGNPKGVVYHHRGAYLNAVSNVLTWEMGNHPVYLWTLPMFLCNGWCFP
ncbi:MAG: AMP-binding protein, partial [Gammaproteobacteria bacterium]|nr:AMP-binding protein [Gammaproteobacteria bacterium]